MRHRIAGAYLCLLAACTAPQTPAQTVFAMEAGYDAAIQVAIVYATLPRCTEGGPKLCSEPDIVRQANSAAHLAWAAIRAAEATARMEKPDANATAQALAAARASLAALRVITDNMKVN